MELERFLELARVLTLIAGGIRLLVIIGYEQRTSKIWTGGLPTLMFLVLIGRVVINEQFDLDLEPDWLLVGIWLANAATQAIASIYGWFPERLVRRIRARGYAP